ncbi:DUF5979 domain-containing protein [Salinibacterium hongtaonis]|uniref:DUF5979 domain-containing protein n=1 Tax=Homoserinimonas hongtaonis TaxID=2079791 RepID=UPI000D3A7143|nr:DUF5979 domain-containing protein [Salinibacterium hongtaonis]AWB90232.1 hypothetical protein C2138_12355 [Salinibacterium hongtaonis]
MTLRAPMLPFRAVRRGRHRLRRSPLVAVLAATLVLLLGGSTAVATTMGAAPAAAAGVAGLSVTKTVDAKTALAPGEEFTYTVDVACADSACLDVVLTDTMPSEFLGFEFVGAPVVTTSTVPTTVALTGCTTAVTAACVLTATVTQAIDGDTGVIPAGDGFVLMFTLKVPQNLTPAWQNNGAPITNTATATASNAAPTSDDAVVTVTVAVDVDLGITKTWLPASQQFQPGVQSTMTLTTRNTSNVPAESLAIQDPQVADANSATLPTSNPFRLVDFAGFGAVTMPQGADRVQVDAYVLDGGVWVWKSGTPAATATLPVGVTAPNVAGLRFSFTDAAGDATIAANGVSGSVAVTVAQRATNREGGASLVLGASANNVAEATVVVPGETPEVKKAEAPYVIGGLNVLVTASKSITPANIPAGGKAAAAISARNDSNGPLTSLTLSDVDFFTADVLFGGFDSAPVWPGGATAASVIWHVGGAAQAPVAFASAATPVAPAGVITGFELVFTGQIAVGATAGADFTIAPTPAFVPTAAASPKPLTNIVTAKAVNPAGDKSATDDAPLNVYFPEIDLSIEKEIKPSGAIPVGGTVVVQLSGVTSGDSKYVAPNKIVITDAATGEADDFWEAFSPTAIAPTQVPKGSTLLVEYRDATGWHSLVTMDATAEAKLLEHTIGAALVPTIVGLRYTFVSVGADFAQATAVAPNAVFQANSTLRTSGSPVAPVVPGVTYNNLAIAQAHGLAGGTTPVASPEKPGDADVTVVPNPGAGVLYADKKWRTIGGSDLTTLVAQSGNDAVTRLSWGVPVSGFSSVTISDPAGNEANPGSTTFQAFDLKRIQSRSANPTTTMQEPLLQWDSVSTIELFYGGVWNVVAPPAGSWMNTAGFKGYSLTPTEVAASTGVRITVIPNDAARTAATTDPLRALPGSGIATGTADASRHFDLDWTLRNTVRDTTSTKWATGTTTFNLGAADKGSLRNTVSIDGTRFIGSPAQGTAHDDITLTDFPPNVGLEVTTSKPKLVIPNPGDVDTTIYPTVDIALVAESTALSRASFLRVTAGTECGPTMPGCRTSATDHDANPFAGATYSATSPFERLDITKLTFTVPAAEVSKNHSMVTLWLRAADGTLTTAVHTITAAELLTAAQLQDVVGVSVVYQASSPATDGGSIVNGSDYSMVFGTQLRETLRGGGTTDFVVPTSLDGFGYAQSYDPVLRPTGADSMPIAADSAPVALVSGELDVMAGKAITPVSVIERDRATTPVTVTLSANDGASTAATHEVVITDTDSRFWNAVQLSSLDTVTKPDGSDRVRVDVQLGTSTWVQGAAGATATLPTVTLADVTGIRFIFDRADGGLFSTTALPADWAASAAFVVDLRSELRDGGAIAFPSSVPNEIDVESRRTETVQLFTPATDDAAASFALETGAFSLDVSKTPAGNVHTYRAGDVVTWTIQFSNTGSGFLPITTVTDTLPAHFLFTGDEPVYTTSAGGLLTTTPTLDTSSGNLVFTWPAGNTRMAPGEIFTITLDTTIEHGAPTPTTNRVVVDTGSALAACTNVSGNGQGNILGLPANQCGTTNYAQIIQGANISATKSVRGEIDGTLVTGAVNTVNATRTCLSDADGFFRNPCAANTVVGATDEWKLTALNSGTESVTALTIVDPLPTAGDRMLDQGGPRDSAWRPVFDESFGLSFTGMPAGATASWHVSTDSAVCVGTGPSSAWGTDSTCAANTWVPESTFSGDWADVTGIRVVYDFTGTATGLLEPGAGVTLLMRTINEPVTAADASLAPVTAPVGSPVAWNQMGTTATFVTSPAMRRAPAKVGVTLASGPLSVTKVVDGDAAAHAPASFDVNVSCEVGGVPVNLGSAAVLTLDASNSLTNRIDGIPLGAECTVAEAGALGAYNETMRTGDVTVLTIDTAASAADAVPAAQTATITNTYEWGSLAINKIANKAFAAIGEDVTYTITVTNTGERTAVAQTVSDTLPESARVVSTSPVAAQSGTELEWDIASLAPGDSTSFTVVVQYDGVGTRVNSASVTVPPGPWLPVTPADPCGDDPTASCVSVSVLALTVTGVSGLDFALMLGLVLLIVGALIAIAQRGRMRTA